LEESRLATERLVTARLLRQMSCPYHDPLLETLAQWVAGGGDPDFRLQVRIGPGHAIPLAGQAYSPQTDLLSGHNQQVSLDTAQRCPPSAAIGVARKAQRFNPELAHQPVQQTPKPGPV